MNFRFIVPDRLKEKYLRDAESEYKKRLSAFGKIEITGFEPEKIDGDSEKLIDAALEAESEKILKAKKGYTIALCVEGKEISSEDLALLLKRIDQQQSTVTFIIGSSYGLSEKVKTASDERISMSKMTFPHQLFRIMLLEQVYRACMINANRKYHK